MRILLWHVHGGYTDAFVRGGHTYLLPTNAARDGWGLGRGGREWPRAVEIDAGALREAEIDVVVLQRPEEADEVERLTGRTPGADLPAVYLEHNTPKPDATGSRHPMADRSDIPIIHVTHFNRLFWDNGDARSLVVEHGVPDPGLLYTGEMRRIGVVINEPVRRSRITGTDLLPAFADVAGVDVFGMGGDMLPRATGGRDLTWAGDLRPADLKRELSRRRVYVHPFRWTSLGLSLLEAMHLGMPVVAVAATEAVRAVPPGAGAISTDLDELRRATRDLLADPDLARERGRAARAHAVAHFGLERFTRRWDEVLNDVTGSWTRRRVGSSQMHGERSTR